MVRALLDGRKTQTRRLASFVKPHGSHFEVSNAHAGWYGPENRIADIGPDFAPFAAGDRLYVREGYYQRGHWEPVEGVMTRGGRQKWAFVPADDVVLFEAPATFRTGRHSDDPATVEWHSRRARFMPRAPSRLTLLVHDVRVERLQAISEADAIAEGVRCLGEDNEGDRCFDVPGVPDTFGEWAAGSFRSLWQHLHGADSWDANPWVVAVSFSVQRGNIDQIGLANG